MSQFKFDEMEMEPEEYYFSIDENSKDNRIFVLIIYDIADNKRRAKFAKFLLGYGFRVQRSAFEALLPKPKYQKLVAKIPSLVDKGEDSVRLYKIIGKGQVMTWGEDISPGTEDILVF